MMRGTQKLSFTTFFLFLLLCFFIFLVENVEATTETVHCHHHHHHHHRDRRHAMAVKKLFVFGDSYADTGNNRKTFPSWNEPYGMTFPGKPSGRYSDGRVFTDFLARSLGLRSPVGYRWRKYSGKMLKYGMNFAYGGTGVFDTPVPFPNITTQIHFFQSLLNDGVFTPADANTSLALLSLSGNDYAYYLLKGGTPQGLPIFITQVVNQLVLDIERIYKLGIRKIAVTALHPLGCLPRNTVTMSFQQCNTTNNQAVSFHNQLLKQALAKLNNQNQDHHSPFFMIDLYDAFFSVFQKRGDNPGSLTFENPLEPCCMGINQNYVCGDVDAKGNKMYTLCEDPKATFFWDQVHPTQAGWITVSSVLQSSLKQLRSI